MVVITTSDSITGAIPLRMGGRECGGLWVEWAFIVTSDSITGAMPLRVHAWVGGVWKC